MLAGPGCADPPWVLHLPACHHAQVVCDGLITVLAGLPETARLTLT